MHTGPLNRKPSIVLACRSEKVSEELAFDAHAILNSDT